MDAREVIKIGMSAGRILVVPRERTVGHFVAHMPMVYATPMMILEMEMASADAIAASLQPLLTRAVAAATRRSRDLAK